MMTKWYVGWWFYQPWWLLVLLPSGENRSATGMMIPTPEPPTINVTNGETEDSTNLQWITVWLYQSALKPWTLTGMLGPVIWDDIDEVRSPCIFFLSGCFFCNPRYKVLHSIAWLHRCSQVPTDVLTPGGHVSGEAQQQISRHGRCVNETPERSER